MAQIFRGAIAAAVVLILTAILPAAADSLRAPGENAQKVAFSASADLTEFDGYVAEGRTLDLAGTITATGPIRRVVAQVYDERLLRVSAGYVWTPEAGEETASLSLDTIRRKLFSKYMTGEKRLTVTVYGDDGESVVIDRRFYAAGDCKPPRNITSDCEIQSSNTRDVIWNDGDFWSEWKPTGAQDALTVALPEGVEAEGMTIVWSQAPADATIVWFDGNGAPVGDAWESEGAFVPYHAYYAFPEGARRFRLTVASGDASVCEMLIYEKGKVSSVVQRWRETQPDWDLMLVSTHQDDEHLFFGAAMSRYVQEGREVGIVYMANCGRDRYGEALDGLWAAGMTNYPVFLGYRDGILHSLRGAYERWGGLDAVVESLVKQIRLYRPEVVVTHDYNGEYGHHQHMATANAVTRACELANDPDYMPESCAGLELWEVKKLYIHLYGNAPTLMDWSQPLDGFGGMTGLEVSKMCYSKHRSQQKTVSYGLALKYSNKEFGLRYSTVGPDRYKDDFFENIEG